MTIEERNAMREMEAEWAETARKAKLFDELLSAARDAARFMLELWREGALPTILCPSADELGLLIQKIDEEIP